MVRTTSPYIICPSPSFSLHLSLSLSLSALAAVFNKLFIFGPACLSQTVGCAEQPGILTVGSTFGW